MFHHDQSHCPPGRQLHRHHPAERSARLHIAAGDDVFLVETPTGYEVTPYDPEFEAQLKSAEKGMRAYRNTLRELAK